MAFILIAVNSSSQTNRALIIAISDYPIDNGWEEIHGVNDCELIIPVLKANGYKQNHIKTLLNEQATKANIINELSFLSQISEKGDYIYLHFSGHGQQMADDNGDEADALDEAFIPFDAYYRYIPGKYIGENHLRDDELEYYIDRIRSKIGSNGKVTVVLDACHSGTGTRVVEDEVYTRGVSYIFASEDFQPEQRKPEAVRLMLKSGSSLSPVTAFSACQDNEINYEYKKGQPAVYYGSLSYFFCQSIIEMKKPESNREFYIRLKNNMKAYFLKKNYMQTPYFESTSENNLFSIGK